MKHFFKEHGIKLLVAVLLLCGVILPPITQEKNPFLWSWLNNFNVFVGLATAVTAYSAWQSAELLRRKMTVQRMDVEKEEIGSSVILTISCGMSYEKMRPSILNYLEQRKADKAPIGTLLGKRFQNGARLEALYGPGSKTRVRVDSDMRAVSLEMERMPDQDGDLISFVSEYATALENICLVLGASGITTIYLFQAGPIVLGTLAGDRFKNQFKLYTFHMNNAMMRYYQVTEQPFQSYVNQNKLIRLNGKKKDRKK